LVKKSLDGYLPATRDQKVAKGPHLQYLQGQQQHAHIIGTQTRKALQGQGTSSIKRKRYSTPRYDVEDLYVREARYDYKPAKGSSYEAKRTSDSSASSATAAEQSDEKSTLESDSKRMRLMYGEPLHKIDVNNVAANALGLVGMDHMDGVVTALVRRRRKQSHPLSSSVH